MPKGEYVRTKEHIEKMSEVTKLQWLDSNKRKRCVEAMNTHEAKVNRSRSAIRKWKDSNIRRKYMEAFNTPEAKSNYSRSSIKKWKNLEIRKKFIKSFSSLEARRKNSEVNKDYKYDGFRIEFDLKMRELMYKILGNKCRGCGEDMRREIPYPHHINSSTKRFGVLGTEAVRYSEKEIEEEIRKCVLLCVSLEDT